MEDFPVKEDHFIKTMKNFAPAHHASTQVPTYQPERNSTLEGIVL